MKRANASLASRALPPLPAGLTPHSLRRTFAGVLYALVEPPPVVMVEKGHTSPALALKVYAQAMRREEGEQAALRMLVEGGQIAPAGAPLGERATREGSQAVGGHAA